MKITIRKMDKTGDTALAFDLAKPEDEAKARAEFDALMKRHATVVAFPKAGTAGETVRRFEDLQEENVVVPAIVGG
jgi:peroxiredoxin